MIAFSDLFEPVTTVTPQRVKLSNSKAHGKKSIEMKKILLKIQQETGGWPVSVLGTLVVVEPDSRTLLLSKAVQFFAWLNKYFELDWLPKHGSKEEFFEYCLLECKEYDTLSAYPHFPQIKNVLYSCSLPAPTAMNATPTLDELVGFYSPDSDIDKTLIKSLILTFLWGGPPGQRPSFVVTASPTVDGYGIGVGKTTLVQTLASLVGGEVMTSIVEPGEKLKTRLLTPDSASSIPRIVLIDNAKSRKLSLQDFEAMVTTQNISGHKMFRGNKAMRNLFTSVITINDASLSRDLASRSIFIHLKDSAKHPGWLSKVTDFIEKNRLKLYAEINYLLTVKEGQTLPTVGGTRWAPWETAVLAKLSNAKNARDEVVRRQREYDEDQRQNRDFHEFLLCSMNSVKTTIVKKSIVVIGVPAMIQLYQDFSNEKVAKNKIRTTIKSLGLRNVHYLDRNGKPKYFLFDRNGEPFNEKRAEEAFHAFELGEMSA